MTKKELNEYFWLKHEITRQKGRLARLEEKLKYTGEIVGDSTNNYSTGKARPIKIQGIAGGGVELPLMIVTLKQEIELNIEKAEKMAVEIEQFIQSVEQAKLRELLRSRFIDCMDWENVGKVNYISPDYARQLINKYFNKHKNMCKKY